MGEVTEVNQEQMQRIKDAGFERTAVEDKMHQERIRAAVMAEVERHIRDLKGGEMNVVEMSLDALTKPIMMTEDEAAKYASEEPAVKNGKVGDFEGYKPDFPTFF